MLDGQGQCRREGGGRGNCPGARKKSKLLCSVICCNDIKVKLIRGPVSISCPGACPISRRPWGKARVRVRMNGNNKDFGNSIS